MVNVVVLIPPPVDKGEAPIHMRNMVKAMVGVVSESIATLLNPAVRGVTAPKKETANLPRKGRSLKILLFSEKQE